MMIGNTEYSTLDTSYKTIIKQKSAEKIKEHWSKISQNFYMLSSSEECDQQKILHTDCH